MSRPGSGPEDATGPGGPLRRVEREVDDELAFHLEEEVERLVAAGHEVEEARRMAHDEAQFRRARRHCVDLARARRARQRREDVMEGWARDLAHAFRSLARSPGFALVAVLTLALGVGANTAVFSVLDSVVLAPLPYPESDRLVRVWPAKNFNSTLALEVDRRSRTVEGVAGVSQWQLNLVGAGDPAALDAQVVHPGYFELFGASPRLGRFFTEEESLEGGDGVVVLSHGLWTERFGADPDVLGRTLQIDGYDHSTRTVVGVMAEDFVPPVGPEPDVWVPLRTFPGLAPSDDDTWYLNHVFGRLAPGAALEAAEAETRSVARAIHGEDPISVTEEDAAEAGLATLSDHLVGDVRGTLWVLLGTVGLVLLIACANLANLVLARGEGKARELAVRSAVGAGRARLLRHTLAESLALGILGGAAGLGLAAAGLEALAASLRDALPRTSDVGLSLPVFLFALAATLAAVVLFGLGPALRTTAGDLQSRLRSGGPGPGGTRRGRRLNRALVFGQVALATVVVVTAAAVGRAFAELVRTDPGFEAEGVVTVSVPLPTNRYPQGEPQRIFTAEVLERVRAAPGVEQVGFIHLLPLTVANWAFPVLPDGFEARADEPLPSANFRVVAGDYFGTLRIPRLRGELFDPATVGPEGDPVTVVNEAFVERFFPDDEALGKTVRLFGNSPFRVVGVVGDIRQFALDREPVAEMYVPYASFSPGMIRVMARGSGEVGALGAAIRAAVWEVDPEIPVPSIRALTDVRAESVARERLFTTLLGTFAALALLLGVVGVYGVTAFAVRTRVREMGVRLAIGAEPATVLRNALAAELTPVAVGLLAGAAGALLARRAAAGFVPGVETGDPLLLGGVVAALGAAAALAAWLPTRRVTRRLDPVSVLRAD